MSLPRLALDWAVHRASPGPAGCLLPAATAGQKSDVMGQEGGNACWGRSWHLPYSRDGAHFLSLSAEDTRVSL